MKPYKIGDGLNYNGEKLTISDICRPCRKVWATDSDGLTRIFKYEDGRLKLASKKINKSPGFPTKESVLKAAKKDKLI